MKNIKTPGFLLIAFILLAIGCKKETIEPAYIRPLITLGTNDLLPLTDMELTFHDATQLNVGITSDFCTSNRTYRWDDEENNFLQVGLYCTENSAMALQLLELIKSKDRPASEEVEKNKDVENIIGDQSYLKGKLFVRDNLVVSFYANAAFDDIVPEIAQCIDDKIRESTSYRTIAEVKPVFESIAVKQNPIPAYTKLEPVVFAKDPEERSLNYRYHFENLIEPKGFSIVPTENFYTPEEADPNIDKVGVEFFAYNDLGFYADTIIYIQLIK